MNKTTVFLAGVATFAASTSLLADVVWDEDVDGSLSTDRFNTTDFGELSVGSNNMICDTQSGISKFFTFTIAEGDELSAIILDDWISNDDLGFLGVVTGDYFSVDPANPDVTQLLGYVHHGETFVGEDILPAMGQGPGSIGFTGALGPGDYSFWIRQGGAELTTQDLNFVVTPTPGALALIGLAGISARRRRG
ncbi:MAG: hypothetical protein MK082_05935 [Phycisphaerales bacterium]|nr:hypothetical protein [Phycisphaerales bacterium]